MVTSPGDVAAPAAAARVLLLGADVGGTHSRVSIGEPLASGAHRVLATSVGPGFNRNSTGARGPAGLVDTVRRALEQAHERTGRADHVVGVLGIAGAGPAHHRQVQETVREALRDVVPSAEELMVLSDMETAFAAGSEQGTGLLLMAGTGAAAVRFEGFAPRARCDGMGWLLGDTGSAVWMGRAVLQAAAADLDGRGPATALTTAVLEHLGIDPAEGDPRQAMIAAVHELTPAQWGALAPLTERCGEDGTATRILDRAAAELLAKVDAVSAPRDSAAGVGAAQIVLTGSVLSRNPPVSQAVHAGLAKRGLQVLPDAPPIDGALRLAHRACSPG